MTWLAQVRHIVWKDVRQSRWILSIYVTIVIAVTARSIALPFAINAFVMPAMFLLVMVGIATAATLVQSDSPIRSDALWASRPFYPSAMLAAKAALVLIVIILLPLAGEIAALGTFQVPRGDLFHLAWQSVLTYTMWLLVAALIAGLTSDFRSFVVMFLGLIVGLFLIGGIPLQLRSPLAMKLSFYQGAIAFFGLALGIALLARLYKTHRGGGRVWSAAIVAAALALAAVIVGSPVLVHPYLAIDPKPQLRIQVVDEDRIGEWRQLHVTFAVENLPDSLAVGFLTDTAILHLRDGKIVRIAPRTSPFRLHMPAPPIRRPARWLSERTSFQTATKLVVPIAESEARAIDSDVSAVELIGTMLLVQPRFAGELPLRAGASMTHEGARARITRVDYASDDSTIDLETTSAARQRLPFVPAGRELLDTPRFALVNTARGEALPLYHGNSSAGSDWLVLPGAPVQEGTLRLGTKTGSTSSVPDQSWLRDATLLIIDWVPVASYPIRPRARLR